MFWVDVDSTSTATNGFRTMAKALGIPDASIEEVLQTLANANERWLLVLDNADDPSTDYASYIPSGTRGAVMITSRIRECQRYSTIAAVALDGLDLESSTQLLLNAAGIEAASWPAHEKQAQDIVHLLGSHTLAVIQAVAYI